MLRSLWQAPIPFHAARGIAYRYFVCIFAMEEPRFFAEYAKQGRAKCKNCKEKLEKSVLRLGRLVPNPFGDDGGSMKEWYHMRCIFDKLSRARATTQRIENVEQLDGFKDLEASDKDAIRTAITDLATKPSISPGKKAKKQAQLSFVKTSGATPTKSPSKPQESRVGGTSGGSKSAEETKDATPFSSFCHLCVKLFNEPSYNAKTTIVKFFLEKVNDENQDVYMVVKLLLPGAVKRVYNLQNKQLVKLFSQIFCCDLDAMISDLDQGDVSQTVKMFFEKSKNCCPVSKSILTLQEVDRFLDKMSTLTREEEQLHELTKITRRCTSEDLKYIIRLIKHDLKINAGAKHVLEALDQDAYVAFHASHNLQDVVERCLKKKQDGVPGLTRKLSIKTRVMTPVKPMLAEACKSFSSALKKCPNGMYAEIKYDGERVQVHKSGNDFQFFSRSLKPVVPHKVAAIKDYLPKACPHGNDLILDSEVLLVDHKTGQPLPFGSLGIHKKSAFKDASVCLFIFDCLQFNDENLMQKSMEERRQLLERNVKEIQNHIKLSETKLVQNTKDLSDLMMRAIDEGLEGLVMKDLRGTYEPGKRHWLKMKKDYLEEGSMADTADLVVLGAYYGTGSKGGMMSVFLMGTYNMVTKQWCTVAKCGNGHDDKTLERINKELSVVKISKDSNKVPSWLNVHKTLVPDFVVTDPMTAPVWEITGAEFSKSTTHTADGVSIRFPRVTKIRADKDWQSATNLTELKKLVSASKESTTSPSKAIVGQATNDEVDVKAGSSYDTETKEREQHGLKRKIEVTEDDESPSNKKLKPVCKYGMTCYQKSRKHKEQFTHEATAEEMPQGAKDDKSLPCIFTNAKFFIGNDVGEKKKLKRYIIAYDGDIVEYEDTSVTHVITNKPNTETTPGQHMVKPTWVWDSIRNVLMQTEEKYKP